MTAAEIVQQLEESAGASYRKILINHGATEPVLGVKISELKKLQKQFRGNYPLALELYATGIYDAQYLAGLITDDAQMTKRDLNGWLTKANCPVISGSIVAWVAAESRYGMELALKWIDSKKAAAAQAGWMTLCSFVSITPDTELNLPELRQLLHRVQETVHSQTDIVRYAMNSYVISIGCYVCELSEEAVSAAEDIGTVSVEMGNTACQVPDAVAYINKVRQRGAIGKKRKTAKC
ncbi:MAG: DNA alkylation repair protein [Planctomycetaceae bacterium]|nr:DNA alkylation repair protein [Planctomycetaceae bacterium]